jgi:tetratricopeptide (TPR) repeat protein
VVLAALENPRATKNARLCAGVFLCLAFVVLSGCSSLAPQATRLRDDLAPALHEHVELTQVPFFPQTEYQCGPAALATVLSTYGVKVTPDELVPEVYLPARKGSLQVEMLAAARRHGLVSYQLAPRFADVLREIAAGNPVIVLQNVGLKEGWHYAVAIGYDYDYGKLYLRSGTTERQVLPFFAHEVLWMRSGYWAMVAVPPDRIPASADEERWLAAIAALEHAGDARNARTAYQTFLRRWPANVNAAIGLANTHHTLGELKDAESVLRSAENMHPDSVVVLNNLAQTLSDEGRNAEALPIIERAAKLGGPFSDAVQDTKRGIEQKLANSKTNSGQRP